MFYLYSLTRVSLGSTPVVWLFKLSQVGGMNVL